jgi:hypothetical protein
VIVVLGRDTFFNPSHGVPAMVANITANDKVPSMDLSCIVSRSVVKWELSAVRCEM